MAMVCSVYDNSKLITIPSLDKLRACPSGWSKNGRNRYWVVSMDSSVVNAPHRKKKEWEKSLKVVMVDYDEGKHEVKTEVRGLGKEQVTKRYRKRLKEGLGQNDWTISEVVAEILKLQPRDDIDNLLNHWAGRFHRKNFSLLVQEICKVGALKHAVRVFNWMKNQRNYRARNDIYNMMIRLYARHNITDQARGLFFEMQKWRLRDWKTTTKILKEMEPLLSNLSIGLINHVLRSIGKSGKVEGMMKIFYKLEQYGIEPTLETYSILLDGLSAAGKWRKCVEILNWLENTRLQPPLSMYEKVLNFLEKEGNMDYVVLVQEKIEKMQLRESVAVK